MGDGSKLVLITPAGMKIDLSKLSKNVVEQLVNQFDAEIEEGEKSLSDVFMKLMEWVKLNGYLIYEVTSFFEHLFRDVMQQNPSVSRMEWHFDFVDGTFPYYFSIERADMDKKTYAVQLVEGYKGYSARYYDMPTPGTPSHCPEDGADPSPTSPEEDEEDKADDEDSKVPIFNMERYLQHYKKEMKEPRQLVDPNCPTRFMGAFMHGAGGSMGLGKIFF